jgi:hypothetical protein
VAVGDGACGTPPSEAKVEAASGDEKPWRCIEALTSNRHFQLAYRVGEDLGAFVFPRRARRAMALRKRG